jgi:phage tail sheath protein FI
VRSFAEFERTFGGLVADLELGYAVQQFFVNGGAEAWIVRVNRGLTPASVVAGLQALATVDLLNLLAIPGCSTPEALAAAVECCTKRRAFLIIDSPKNASPTEMEQAVQSRALGRSPNAALYYPWIKLPDPLRPGELRLSPPSGSIAGVIARSDNTRGVWKAPAGVEAVVRGAAGLERPVNDHESGLLNARGVNCLRVMRGVTTVWGSRTLAGDDADASEWKYIPVRRLALFLEESIERGLQWAVFEHNDEPLWAAIRLNVGAFLHELCRAGAFQGSTPKNAYFTKCGRETMTQADVESGAAVVLVGFAPLKPAEFVIMKLRIKAAVAPD